MVRMFFISIFMLLAGIKSFEQPKVKAEKAKSEAAD